MSIWEYIAAEGSRAPQYIAVGGGGAPVGDRCQTACKPGSVRGRPPTRWPFIWDARHRAPRATDPGGRSGNRPGAVLRPRRAAPTWSCSRRGLPCRTRCRVRGALLPHPFTLARRPCGPERAVCSLWHFPWGRPRRALPGSVFPRSPDFPPPRARGGDGGHPAVWPALTTPAPGPGQAALSLARRHERAHPVEHGLRAGVDHSVDACLAEVPLKGAHDGGRDRAELAVRREAVADRSQALLLPPDGGAPIALAERWPSPAGSPALPGQRPIPASARRAQSKSSPGSCRRMGATSACATTLRGSMGCRATMARARSSRASIWAGGNGR